jgi:hypothetical protein
MAIETFRRTLKHLALIVTVLTVLTLTPVSTTQATPNDLIGPTGSGSFGKRVAVLPNGNIVVTDPDFDAGSTVDVGAVYLYDGATGTLISTLTGSTTDDQVGSYGVTVLSNGNYVVRSPYWDDGGAADVGAVTWGNGATGISGVVSSSNSLVGSTADDQVGSLVTALSNGNYVVSSPYWDSSGVANVGAVTMACIASGIRGPITGANSVRGTAAGGGSDMVFAYDDANDQLVVGRPADNTVTLFRVFQVYLPLVLRNN